MKKTRRCYVIIELQRKKAAQKRAAEGNNDLPNGVRAPAIKKMYGKCRPPRVDRQAIIKIHPN